MSAGRARTARFTFGLILALDAANVDCCALANNHLLDFGTIALEDTISHLNGADIVHTGAGRDIEEALNPACVLIDGLDVAVVSLLTTHTRVRCRRGFSRNRPHRVRRRERLYSQPRGGGTITSEGKRP